MLSRPLLYLSLFFKRHRTLYYEHLNAVRTRGDWEGWLSFFLEGVEVIAREASHIAQALFRLVSEDRQRLLNASDATLASLRLFELLPHRPIITASLTMRLLGVSRPTAIKTLTALTSAGVLTAARGQGREQVYSYLAYLDLLREGTEL